jgi:hypothetical protein
VRVGEAVGQAQRIGLGDHAGGELQLGVGGVFVGLFRVLDGFSGVLDRQASLIFGDGF